MRRLFLGIDVSTTGAKALLIDEQGAVAASATTPLTLQTPRPLWSEQDPHEWWKGTSASIRKALADAGASGARRRRGRPHRPDARPGAARRQARACSARRSCGTTSAPPRSATEIETRVGRAALIREVGNVRAHRLHRSEDPLGPQPRAGGLPRRRSWCCCRRTTCACASRARRRWTRRTARARSCSSSLRGPGRSACSTALDIPREWLPRDVRGAGGDRGRDAARLRPRPGSRPGTPVMAGGGDQAAGAVGAGAVRPGVVSLTLGTSGVVFATTDSAAGRARGPAPRLLPRRPRQVALHGRHAVRRGQPAVVPRHAHAEARASPTLVAEAEQAPAGSEGAAVPALPLRRAHALPRPARARQLRGAHAPPPARRT